MTIEKGKVTENGDQATIEKLQQGMELMQKELLELKKKNLPQATAMAAAMTAEELGQVIAAAKERPDHEKFDGISFVDERSIDPSDHHKEGVLFSTYKVGYVIVDDVRQGLSVRTPYGNTIFFTYQGSRKSKNGREEDISSYSIYVSHSKKEIEWLRKHKYFNIAFFENTKALAKVDSSKAQRLLNVMNLLSDLDMPRLLKMVADKQKAGHDIHPGSDINDLRHQLAYIVAGEQADHEKMITKKALSDSRQAQLVQNAVTD